MAAKRKRKAVAPRVDPKNAEAQQALAYLRAHSSWRCPARDVDDRVDRLLPRRLQVNTGGGRAGTGAAPNT
ncbi:MAG TPA: hypothetical protein VH021_06220 [Trebonia sp.]|nr:hypothetical protein [Trebonia sp.]